MSFAVKSMICLLLVFAFLLSAGLSFGLQQAEQPGVCCEQETQDAAACARPDCICSSCISLVPVPGFQMEHSRHFESAGLKTTTTTHIPGYFRSIERPPKSC